MTIEDLQTNYPKLIPSVEKGSFKLISQAVRPADDDEFITRSLVWKSESKNASSFVLVARKEIMVPGVSSIERGNCGATSWCNIEKNWRTSSHMQRSRALLEWV